MWCTLTCCTALSEAETCVSLSLRETGPFLTLQMCVAYMELVVVRLDRWHLEGEHELSEDFEDEMLGILQGLNILFSPERVSPRQSAHARLSRLPRGALKDDPRMTLYRVFRLPLQNAISL